MLSKIKFIQYINRIIDYMEYENKLSSFIDFGPSKVGESISYIIDSLVELMSENNEEIEDLINWWLYEDVEKIIWEDDKEIDVSTPGKLYDYLKSYNMNTVNIKVINKSNNKLPQYETDGAAAMDVRVDLSRVTPDNPIKAFGDAEVIWTDKSIPMIRIAPNSRALLPTGLFTAIPNGYQISFRPRSGLAIKKGLQLANTPSTIDSDYRGEWMLPVINLGTKDIYIENGERICQALLEEVNHIEWNIVNSLDNTERGNGGFNSTGTK